MRDNPFAYDPFNDPPTFGNPVKPKEPKRGTHSYAISRFPSTVESDWKRVGDGLRHVTSLVSDTARVYRRVLIGPNSLVGHNTVLHDDVLLDSDVKVGNDCQIRECSEILQGSQLGQESYLESRVTIFPRCDVGNNVHLIRGTVILEECTIGDRVDILEPIRLGARSIIISDTRINATNQVDIELDVKAEPDTFASLAATTFHTL